MGKKKFRRFWNVLLHVEAAWGLVTSLGGAKIAVGAVTGSAAAFWGWVVDLEGPFLLLIGLGVAAFVLTVWNQITIRRYTKQLKSRLVSEAPPSTKPLATAEDFESSYTSGKKVRISDVPREGGFIKGRTFENCELEGPAVLVPMGRGLITQSSSGGDLESLFWVIEESRERVLGAVGLLDCNIIRCDLRDLGLAGPKEAVDEWRKGFAG